MKLLLRDLRAFARQLVCIIRRKHRKLLSIGHLVRPKGGFAPVPLQQCEFCGVIQTVEGKKQFGTRRL